MARHPVKKRAKKKKGLTKRKAKLILKHGEVRGKKITRKQRGLFGAVSRGQSRKVV